MSEFTKQGLTLDEIRALARENLDGICAEVARLRAEVERLQSYADGQAEVLKAVVARAEAAKARERVLREALGEIGTACEDKALRAYPVQDTSGSKRQKIIDYVHGVARAALGEGESRG